MVAGFLWSEATSGVNEKELFQVQPKPMDCEARGSHSDSQDWKDVCLVAMELFWSPGIPQDTKLAECSRGT